MKTVLEKISELTIKFNEVAAEYGNEAQPRSIRVRDMTTFPEKNRITEAFSLGEINLRLALDNLTALPGIVLSNAPLLVVVAARAILEESSLAMWFLDPNINATERVRRNIMQMCQGKIEVKKLHLINQSHLTNRLSFINNNAAESAEITAQITKSKADVAGIDDFFDNRLANILTACGTEFKKTDGKVTAPQNLKPDISQMIEDNFDGEARAMYKIFSGIAHGQTNTIITFLYDYENARSKDGLNFVEHKPKIEIIFVALKYAILSFEKAVKNMFETNGWDFAKIEPAFKEFDSVFKD